VTYTEARSPPRTQTNQARWPDIAANEDDLRSIHDALTRWLSARIPGGEDVRLSPLRQPGAGVSNETFLFQASWREAGGERSEELVLRLGPRDFLVFPEYDLAGQARVMQALAGTGVPVPVVRWLETDESVLGRPFYVMGEIEGEIPSEMPPYHAVGFCREATPERRARLWRNGVETIAGIHALDWDGLGLSFLGVPEADTGPLDRQLDYYESFLDWARGDQPQPILRAALQWLRQNRFVPSRVTLCWGDSRLVNLIYRDDEVVGVLDWEMAFLGDPVADLAWWIFFDWHHSEGLGIPRLEGFPGLEETVGIYEDASGHEVENLFYHDVMAAFRFGVIMVRVAEKLKMSGSTMATADLGTNNACTRRLASLLDLPPPGEAARTVRRAEEATVRVQFHLTGEGGGDWYLIANQGKGTRHEGTVADPDVTLVASAADWEAIQRGDVDRTQAYLSGKLVIEGEVALLMQLEELISSLARAGPSSTKEPASG
jgi:aminoglycoside phosphotransferase (APT) family kinase protein/putative sterol carrier protein